VSKNKTGRNHFNITAKQYGKNGGDDIVVDRDVLKVINFGMKIY
jgi:hypothetical protein